MKKVVLTLAVLMIVGCAQYSGYRPVIDTYNDKNAYRLNQDVAECEQLAHEVSGGGVTEAGKGVGIGGLVGAGAGAAIGSVFGSPGAGAAVGAAALGIGGATHQGMQSDSRFRNSFNNCVERRGHVVLR